MSVVLLLVVYSLFRVLNSNIIYDGIKIDEFNVSNMTEKEALKFLNRNMEKLKKRNIRLTYNDKKYIYSIEDLGFEFLYEEAVNEAYQIGRTGNIINRLINIIKVKLNGREIKLQLSCNRDKILKIVESISDDIHIEAKDAKFHFNNGHIHIEDEVVGKSVDKEELINRIIGNINSDNIYGIDEIEIPVINIIPKISKNLLSRINGIIGEYSTSFLGSSKNRIENIRLSAKAIKGKMLLPGESISFNETTGPIRKEYGYKDAKVIIGGKYTSGIGGGVCQTSTTLYNALLLAGVTILERSPHSIPPAYVGFGHDAAVAENLLDLKFRNDFEYPIYIDTEVKNNRIYVYIYGDTSERDYTVKVESKITEVIKAKEEIVVDEKLKPGVKLLVQEGRNGYKVKTYRYIIKNGTIVDKELISDDYYREMNYIYKVGKIQ